MDDGERKRRYTLILKGFGGCTYPTIDALLDGLRADLESADDDAEVFTITMARLSDDEMDALPDFEGY